MYKLWNILLAFWTVKAIALVSNIPRVFPVNIVVPKVYLDLYEETHDSLMVDLQIIATSLSSAFNNVESVKKLGIQVAFEINENSNNAILPGLSSAMCGTSVADILGMLNQINQQDNTQDYIVFIPCPGEMYSQVFNSKKITSPIIESRSNVECSKRVGMFLELKFPSLLNTFANCLIRILGGPLDEYINTTETSMGDSGLKLSSNISDSIAEAILNNVCFHQSINSLQPQ